MARRRAARAAAGVALQIELTFADASAGDVLIARADALMLAVAIALRRRAPLVAVVLAGVAFITFEQFAISDDGLVAPFFAVLVIAYSLGANLGRRLALIVARGDLFAGGMTTTLPAAARTTSSSSRRS